MLIQDWLVVAAAVVVACVWMSLIKDAEGDSLRRRFLKRVGAVAVVAVIVAVLLHLMPTAVVVDNNKTYKIMKVAGAPKVNTEWGFVIPLEGLESAGEYVVNKSLDTLILFPLIYSRAGFRAYDSYNLTHEVVDIPPGEYRKVDYNVSTFFVIPDEDLLRLTSESRGKDYALMTRPQLGSLLNQIIVVQAESFPQETMEDVVPALTDDFPME